MYLHCGGQHLVGLLPPLCMDLDPCGISTVFFCMDPKQWWGPRLYLRVPPLSPLWGRTLPFSSWHGLAEKLQITA